MNADGSSADAAAARGPEPPIDPTVFARAAGAAPDALETAVVNCIVVIETRTFLAECIRKCLQPAFESYEILIYSSVSEVKAGRGKASPKLLMLSLAEGGRDAAHALQLLSQGLPDVPVVVLAGKNDADSARAAIRNGAKGFIPMTTGFKIAIEAVRFVLSGGTYVPTECLFAPSGSAEANALGDGLTARELAVVRALQKGKPNKVIAYELNMCESTVKVHLRNIMKKLGAKNRTDVAMKVQTYCLPERKAPPELSVATL